MKYNTGMAGVSFFDLTIMVTDEMLFGFFPGAFLALFESDLFLVHRLIVAGAHRFHTGSSIRIEFTDDEIVCPYSPSITSGCKNA